MNLLMTLPAILAFAAPMVAEDDSAGLITYDIRLVESSGLAWRDQFQARFQFRGHRSGSSIWIADPATLSDLAAWFESDPSTRTLQAPRISSYSGAPAVVQDFTTHQFVVHAASPSEGRDTPGRSEPQRPVLAAVDDGFRLEIVGDARPEGVMLKFRFVDSRIVGVHRTSSTPRQSGNRPDPESVTIQVPEVTRTELGGSGFVPTGHGLVVSLGARSTTDGTGRTRARDQLLLITPSDACLETRPLVDNRVARTAAVAPEPDGRAVPSNPAQPTAISAVPILGWGLVPVLGSYPDHRPHAPVVPVLPPIPISMYPAQTGMVVMPAPAPPSRTLPSAIGPDGKPVNLPPLPDARANRAAFHPFVKGNPVPSPQAVPSAPEVVEDSTVQTSAQNAQVDQVVQPTNATTKETEKDRNSKASDTPPTLLIRFPIGRGHVLEWRYRLD